jgi:RND family efflux transporter MFP subunit
MADQSAGLPTTVEASALAELALCENLSQTSGWAARWSAQVSGADGALLWAPDAVHPLFLCIGAHGDGTQGFLRRSVPRDGGLVADLVRGRRAIVLDASDFSSGEDPWLNGLPATTQTAIAVPLEAEGMVVGLLALLFAHRPQTQATLSRLDGFLRQAAPALGRALRAERKTVGMLHAIERLTNLYDLSKAFGSTIDLEQLNALIVGKAVDFGNAEVGSLWMLEGDEVALAATGVNENYEVENAPEAVGSSIVGDVLGETSPVKRNQIADDDPLSEENAGYPVRSMLAVPLLEEDAPVGALVLVNKRSRHPEFSAEDEELLQDLGRQAVRALRNARQYEAEKKVEELDALLAVSREITATLDLDRVMKTVVNGAAALIRYDRCAIGILDRGRVRVGAISGMDELDRRSPEVRATDDLLQWVYYSGTEVRVTQDEDGTIVADRPETEAKFRELFRETGLRSFYGVLLADEEGKLGALVFESREPLQFDEETRDLLQILVNQATVAVRNAQLYQEVPLAGFWKPLLEKRKKLEEIPRARRIRWAVGIAVAGVLLFLVPWPFRIAGPARVLPGQRASITAGVDGLVSSVLKHEGDRVAPGDVVATLKDESYQADFAQARGELEIAESEMSRGRQEGNAAAVFAAQSRRDELSAKIALAQEQLERTRLRAPARGVIVTPRIEERVGQYLKRGEELCVVADAGTVTAEVAVPESDASLLRPGEPASLKLNPYPGRTFRGVVSRVGARLREQGEDRFLIAEVRVENPDGALRTGMLGMGKVRIGRRSLATLLLRKPARYLWSKVWPLLP